MAHANPSNALVGVATDAMTKATREQLYECIWMFAMNTASYWTWYGDLPEDELRHRSLRAMSEQQVCVALSMVVDRMHYILQGES